MALDEAAKEVYRQAGPAVMLALLPEIRLEAERAKEQAQHFERAKEEMEASDIEIAEEHNVPLAILDRRFDAEDTEGRALLRQLRDRFAKARASLGRPGDTTDEAAMAFYRYLFDLVERERWIRDELKRLGLFPRFSAVAEDAAEDTTA